MIRSIALGLALTVLVLPSRGQQLPDDFSSELVVSGLSSPVGIAFTSDARLFVTEKNSARILVCDLRGDTRVCGTVPDVDPVGERGLLGIAVDPGWPERPYVYVHFTGDDDMVHIARYTVDGDVGDPGSLELSLGDRYEVVASIPDNSSAHNGGTVRFGPDGMLYASVGEDNNECAAQSHVDARGAILRIDVGALPDGAGGPPPLPAISPPDNPFPAAAGLGPLVWSIGLRNPFRFNIDPVTGHLYVADVGRGDWEELNEVAAKGLNLGWPILEGNEPHENCPEATPPYEPPITAISHDDDFVVIISTGGRYRNQPGGIFNFGTGYEGDVFFHDWAGGEMRRLKWNGVDWETPPPVPGQPGVEAWATGFDDVVDAVPGPDGAIYYVNLDAGEVWRLGRDVPSGERVTVMSGDGQVGVAGQVLSEPLVVQLTTATGEPMPGIPVTFSVPLNAGVFQPPQAVTDVAGLASTTLALGERFAGSPLVRAAAPGAQPATFDVTWRGLNAEYFYDARTIVLNVRMATPHAPLWVTWDDPVAQPRAVTQFGELWTSILDPLPSLGVVGMLFTDQHGILSASIPMMPPGLGTILVQAIGHDFSLSPSASAVFISNPRTLMIDANTNLPQVEAVLPVTTGTAGRGLVAPMTVRVTGVDGSPLAGVPVNFALTSGGGILDPQPRITDGSGRAFSDLILSTADPTDPQVTAIALGSAPVDLRVIWRGLTIDHTPGSDSLTARVRLVNPQATVWLAWETGAVASPYSVTPWGEIWTSVFEAQPTAGLIAGTTDSTGSWSTSLTGIASGTTLTLQAYGNDPPMLWMVSLPVTVTFD